MRAIGFAALSFGAVIALSATLGMSYRSDASPMDDPSTSAADSSSPAASDSTAPSDSSTPSDDPTTTAPADSATPSDSGTPTDSGTPEESGSPSDTPSDAGTPADDEGGTIQPFFFVSPPPADGALRPTVSYQFGPASVVVHGAPTGTAQFAQTELWSWAPGEGFSDDGNTCPAPSDTNFPFGDTPGAYTCTFDELTPGVYNPATEQDDGTGSPTRAYVDDYFVVPDAPSILDASGDVGKIDLFGTGIAGDTVTVLMDGSTPVCSNVPVQDGTDEPFWSCTTSQVSFGEHALTAVQTDQGAGQNDQVSADDPDIHYLTGGQSPQSENAEVTVNPVPSLGYSFTPGGVTATADFGGSAATGGETDLGQPEEGFHTDAACVWPGTNPSSSHAGVCTFAGIDPGGHWLDSYQESPDVEFTENVYAYFVIPGAPAITSTLHGNRTVTFRGNGAVPGNRVHIVDAGGAEACSTAPTVGGDGSWSCTTPVQRAGTHNWRAVQQDLTACADAEDSSCNYYVSGALSSYSPVVSVKVPAAPGSSTIPDETTASTDWTFTVTGIDLNNVHPGDTFTVTGSGLPPGSTVSGELHSKAVSIGSAVVQPDGTFSLPVTVPADFPAGAHTIVMTLTPPGSTAVASQQPLKVVPAAASGGSTDSTPAAEDNSSPIGGSEGPGIDNHGPNSNILTHGLNSIADVLAHPAKIPTAIEIGLVLLVFAVLPGHLLNATLAEQYERFTKRRSQRRHGGQGEAGEEGCAVQKRDEAHPTSRLASALRAALGEPLVLLGQGGVEQVAGQHGEDQQHEADLDGGRDLRGMREHVGDRVESVGQDVAVGPVVVDAGTLGATDRRVVFGSGRRVGGAARVAGGNHLEGLCAVHRRAPGRRERHDDGVRTGREVGGHSDRQGEAAVGLNHGRADRDGLGVQLAADRRSRR